MDSSFLLYKQGKERDRKYSIYYQPPAVKAGVGVAPLTIVQPSSSTTTIPPAVRFLLREDSRGIPEDSSGNSSAYKYLRTPAAVVLLRASSPKL